MKLIAECGVNWTSIEEAKAMIMGCKAIGAEYAKFQLFDDDIIKNSPFYEMIKPLILEEKDVHDLVAYGNEIDQKVFFSTMYPEAIDIVNTLEDIELIKIRYKDRYNEILLKKALKTDKRILISTDFDYNVPLYLLNNIAQIDLIYCVPNYPAKEEEYNHIFDHYYFNFFNGISDHTKDVSILTKALGYNIEFYEKHIKLDNTIPLEDAWSIKLKTLKKFLSKC